MGYANIERDLAFIRRTMETASRYDNIPATGYLAIGLIGFVGVGATYALVGPESVNNLNGLASGDLWLLAAVWGCVFLAALCSMILLSAFRARRLGVTAWNSLAARMFLSQIPQVAVSGALTIGLALRGQVDLVPVLWLLHFGVISYSFSYFTGPDHKIQGIVFMALGVAGLFGPGHLALPLLAAGFGGVNTVFGLFRMIRTHNT